MTPTIDMRIDDLAPATGERLEAEAEVTRNVRKSPYDFRATRKSPISGDGNGVATVTVDIEDGTGTQVATARGVYKTGGVTGETPWTADEE